MYTMLFDSKSSNRNIYMDQEGENVSFYSSNSSSSVDQRSCIKCILPTCQELRQTQTRMEEREHFSGLVWHFIIRYLPCSPK
mmetsp:Transcript_13562/g.16832  ORF Transcript_13562/g.16832 Transcript_13562/m.16832 type:complete len:82 (-) Transcript_13562:360-605(-)